MKLNELVEIQPSVDGPIGSLSEKIGIQFEDYKLPFNLQRQIINMVLEDKKNNTPNKFDQSYQFWEAKSVRYLDMASVNAKYHQQKFSQVEYLYRHHHETRWVWHQNPLADIIRPILEDFCEDIGLSFDLVTRVKIHLQKPTSNVSLHRDLTAGSFYMLENPLSTKVGPSLMQYQMYPWVDLSDFSFYKKHDKPKYFLSLKIPLSTDPVHFGKQTALVDTLVSYSTKGQFYFLNEMNEHGAFPVNYIRGLIFIDGLFTEENVLKLKFSEIDTRKVGQCDL